MRNLLQVAICLLALVSAARASVSWVEVDSPHFHVVSDAGPREASDLVGQLERMRLTFATLMQAHLQNSAPILVLALRDRKEFRALEPTAYLGKGKLDLAGYFIHRTDNDYILLRLDVEGEHPYATIYHEYTHYLLRDKSSWMPLWLNEGLAEFYQNTDIYSSDVNLGQPSVDDLMYLRTHQMIPVSTLVQIDANSPYYHEEQKGSIFYSESWELVHYLIITDRKEHRRLLEQYQINLVQHQDSLTAARNAFGDLNTLDRQLHGYLNGLSYSYFRLPISFKVNESSFPEHSISIDDVNAIRAGVLIDNQRAAEAETLLHTVLQNDPKNVRAIAMMGYDATWHRNAAEAEKWYAEAAALDPGNGLVQYHFAVAAMRIGDTSRDAEVEAALHKTIALDPDFAPAYDALARFYGMHNEKLNEAHMLEVQAVSLEPDNVYYRLNAANELAQQNMYDSALSVLQAARPVARTPLELAAINKDAQRIAQVQTMTQRWQQEQEAMAKRDQTDMTPTGGSPAKTTAISGTAQFHPGRVAITTDSKGQPIINLVSSAPNYPMMDPTGPQHTVSGIVRKAVCYYPTLLTVILAVRGQTIQLYRNSYYKVRFSAVNYTPKGDLNPCTDLTGLKAKVVYSEVNATGVAGQILAMQLSK